MDTMNRWEGMKIEDGEAHLSYLFENDAIFSDDVMHALLSSKDENILRCILIHWNGIKKCIYLKDECRLLGPDLPYMESGRFYSLMLRLLQAVQRIRETNQLDLGNIDLNLDHIFLDEKQEDIRLVCLPVVHHPISEELYEFELKQKILQWLKRLPLKAQTELSGFQQQLENADCSLLEIISANSKKMQRSFKELLLESMEADPPVTYHVNCSPFFIGRRAVPDQGRIDKKYNFVGRLHCKIEWSGNEYILTDLNSRNGTWINEKRLEPGASGVIKPGDIIRLMELSFLVKQVGEV